jgi:hypothetical protein
VLDGDFWPQSHVVKRDDCEPLVVDASPSVLHFAQHAVSTDPTEPPELNPHVFEEDFGDYNTILLRGLQISDVAGLLDFACLLELVKFSRNLRNVGPLSDVLGTRFCPN